MVNEQKLQHQIKVVLIDQYQLFREGVKNVLENETSFDIIASSDDYSVLDYVLESHQVDVILLDATVFIAHLQHVKEIILHQNSKVIILGTDTEDNYVKEAIKVGVHGYLFKEMDMFSFVEAIKLIIAGKSYYHPYITSELVNEYRNILQESYKNKGEPEVQRPLHLYTNRECEVLQLLTDGQSNRKIAETLDISEKTVKNHVSSLFKKMHVNDRTQAVVMAIRNNWVKL